MTLLTVVQDICRVNGLNVPNIVVSSLDSTILQLLGLANELVESMTDESKFQAFTYEALHTYLPQEDQGSIYDIASSGLLWINSETLYDRTLKRPIFGPLSDRDWQMIKAMPNPGPFYRFRLRQDHLLIAPVPTAPLSLIAFEYASSYGVKDSLGATKPYFTADTDTFVLPEKILKRGLSYRWKQAKGLPYQADETAYYSLLNNAIARDKVKSSYDLANTERLVVRPGIIVPSGTWPVSDT
jgi:hypothetical protein